METLLTEVELNRDTQGAPCTCNGFADRLDDSEVTEQEIKSDLNCARDYACCIAAFKCRLCSTRFVRGLAAPESSW